MTAHAHIIDPDDFCRMCRGKGVLTPYEYTDTGLRQICERCFDCDGTGRRTVLILNNEHEIEPGTAGRRIDPRGQGGTDRAHPQIKGVATRIARAEASSDQAVCDVPRLGRAKQVREDGCRAPLPRKLGTNSDPAGAPPLPADDTGGMLSPLPGGPPVSSKRTCIEIADAFFEVRGQRINERDD